MKVGERERERGVSEFQFGLVWGAAIKSSIAAAAGQTGIGIGAVSPRLLACVFVCVCAAAAATNPVPFDVAASELKSTLIINVVIIPRGNLSLEPQASAPISLNHLAGETRRRPSRTNDRQRVAAAAAAANFQDSRKISMPSRAKGAGPCEQPSL